MKKSHEMPKWVNKVIRRLCGDFLAEGIQGDFFENFKERKEMKGARRARLWMYLELLLLCRFIFYRKEKTTYQNSNVMFREYFKIGFRVVKRNKVYSFINLFGLGAGMACSLLIYLWVTDELSYDRFHENIDELYSIEFDNGRINNQTGNPSEMAPAIKEQIPEITYVSRFRYGRSSAILQYGRNIFHEENYANADPDFFKMFSFDFLLGSPETALDDPFSMVITESFAQKYFGNGSPIGESMKLNNEHMMTVTGVIKDVPANSSFQFDFLLPLEYLKVSGEYMVNWSAVWLNTYVQIDQSVDKVAVADKVLKTIVRGKHNRWSEESIKALVFNPLKTMRLKAYSYTGAGFEQQTLQSIYTFSALGLLILLIACINFMNLSTARSAKRAKEIGMRKVVGAVKGNIRTQFLGESLLQAVFALTLAVVLVLLLLTPFNQLAGKQLDIGSLFNLQFLAALAVVTLVVAFVAGSYPAFYLSSFQPIKVLKGHLSAGMKSATFRKVLVIVQFGLSTFLIIGTLVIYFQMNYIQDKDLGYDKELVLYVPLIHEETRAAYESLKTNWQANPEVKGVSASQVKPSFIGWSSSAEWEGKDPEDYEDIYHNRISRDYLNTLGIELIKGRDFTPEFPADDASDGRGNFIINETLAKKMSPEGESLGMVLNMAGSKGTVVGIMKDFHFSSLKRSIRPLAFLLMPERKEVAILKLKTNNVGGALSRVEKWWNEALPDYPFEYHFLDEDFERAYRAERQLGDLLATFSLLAIIIASLGLFGLASFTAEERKKEVAIRKVLGATDLRVTYLLCKDFMVLVLLANLIAWPMGRWIMGDWLSGFAYRIDFGLEIFLFAALLAFAIALLTIVFQTFKAVLVNPVVALKYE